MQLSFSIRMLTASRRSSMKNCKQTEAANHQPASAIRVIIFDLSEVLIAGLCGVEESLALRFRRPGPEILSAFGGELLIRLCRGEISEDFYLESIIANNAWEISL